MSLLGRKTIDKAMRML